ncbi:MAG: hypothetical protein EB082_17620, partial [Verrucomicrobia bacterium]|nr:hypothetical protein [Verrucomicrobiota bacterium]
VGDCMKYHPHGDASIGDALVVLANKRYLIEGQGNFGNIFTGDPAAAPRYIECRLTELARTEVFNDEITQFVPSYDGRNKEPVMLPSKLPLTLMLGAEGIAVGLSCKILPHTLSLDEVALVRQHHERVADGSIAVRVILHAIADDVGNLHEPPVIGAVQRPEDAALHGLQTVFEIGDGAVADDVGGVFEEALVHAAVERQFAVLRREDAVRQPRRFFGDDVRAAVAVGGGKGGRFTGYSRLGCG